MVRLNRIYTRTGDDGTTGLVDGSRVAKSDLRMAAMGDVDELNGFLGVVVADCAGEKGVAALLKHVQNDLFDLGADLATPGEDFTPGKMELRIVQAQVDWLEARIDEANRELEPLKSFVLPGGNRVAAGLHVARSVARRAERTTVAAAAVVPLNPLALAYINRLSDFLFVLARSVNKQDGGDVLWVPGASR
ncbi:cob(I)yrinic acid a,c-diamide adenosyltransferase [Stakelama saccharophila]|uniref:Corrinoid adenosyltransferase n=1 Tax=Stakelama saccharophila TaxID=3075605 RepID=A0ABZ0BAC9_9SPHN|nr:cob(I)yrinic acid a,c-diamide adenosyltransferase [Stakelama sp. W311]WNO54344.1 cob(I)yrinic acid a,c-diamide adenosyltransferase [Stakelama sp. W311]